MTVKIHAHIIGLSGKFVLNFHRLLMCGYPVPPSLCEDEAATCSRRMCEKSVLHISLIQGMFYFTYMPLFYLWHELSGQPCNLILITIIQKMLHLNF